MTKPASTPTELHQLYLQTTGLHFPFHMGLAWCWEYWSNQGYTADDLAVVVAHLKKGIARGDRYPGSLRFSRLIKDLDNFAEELALARKVIRPKPAYPPQKAAVLRATARPDEPPSAPIERARVILERTKLATMLGAWRAQNL